MKPISVPLYFFSDGVGQTVLHALLVVPSLLCALLLVHIDVPSPATFAAFLLAFAVGYGVNFFLNFLMNCVAFWTLETFAAQLIVRWVSDLALGADHSADVLSGHPRQNRLRAALCRDLLDAAADLRRRHPALAVGSEHRDADRVARALRRRSRRLVWRAASNRVDHPGRLTSGKIPEHEFAVTVYVEPRRRRRSEPHHPRASSSPLASKRAVGDEEKPIPLRREVERERRPFETRDAQRRILRDADRRVDRGVAADDVSQRLRRRCGIERHLSVRRRGSRSARQAPTSARDAAARSRCCCTRCGVRPCPRS